MKVIRIKTKSNHEYKVGNNCDAIVDHVLFYDVYVDGAILRLYDVIEAELEASS